jgi:hypothetical protein
MSRVDVATIRERERRRGGEPVKKMAEVLIFIMTW